ncbi:DNA polymerase III subunit gamma/tau [Puniceicoccus vermicola]|uniref:DNA polymerase III subunit gamma/tau n=1 Tax=Puniceicoccus vermicola TaxID=388746 RepID=A0A7X1B220_9BACT|nr:DNA polymerase III subunit gamma/tau [Puniceicoccus vermicola]MBC2604196.1 DNA polymerase III subunit gamma/tau [Puniceicoccus vermicola]
MTDTIEAPRDPHRILTEAWEKGRLGHAILLYGPASSSLENVAFALASQILGVDGVPTKHPDCSVVRPVNKMRQIGVDAMRRLVRTVSHSANQGGRKVGIVLDADRMNLQASNAFLKTLEEPPSDTTLFLLSTRPNDLLDTIRSRCMSFKISGDSVAIEGPEWESWSRDFEEWLSRIEVPPANQKDVAETVMRLYGLVQRFQECLSALSARRLEAAVADFPEDVEDEEKVAIEAGIERGARQDLLAGIEAVLRDWVVSRTAEGNAMADRARKLVLAVEETEGTSGLLALNFNGVAAVEQLMIRVLRIWSRQ